MSQPIPPVPPSPPEEREYAYRHSGIIGAILAFISLALPWWVVNISSSEMGYPYSAVGTVYLYQYSVSIFGVGAIVSSNLPLHWYATTALVFLILSGLLGLIGYFIVSGRKVALALGGILALFSIIIFSVGLQNDISNGAVSNYPTGASLFSSGSYSLLGVSINYSAYLSFGFWLALVATIIMFAGIHQENKKEWY